MNSNENKKIINLTHHPITIMNKKGELVTIPPSGQIARADFDVIQVDEIDNIPIYEIKYKNIVGLPEPKEGVIYVVSAIMKNAVPDRRDVVATFNVDRIDGKPTHCKGFRVNG